MADKEQVTNSKEQIIIDGVDVGECEYLTYQLEEDGQYYWFCNIAPVGGPDECEYRPECFYKKIFRQLTRKTQECENLKAEEKYLKQCYEKAGEELSKHSFDYDGKEKNLVVQAMELNEKYEKFEKALEEIEKYCSNAQDPCQDNWTREKENFAKIILDIIRKAKGGE